MDFPFEKALTKLTELVKDGTSGAVAPWQIKRKGLAAVDAKRDELLVLAQTEMDVKDIKDGKKVLTEDRKLIDVVGEGENQTDDRLDGKIEPYLDLEAITVQAQTRQEAQAIQEEINLTKTIILAQQEIETGKYDANDEPVEPDWFTRWRDNAEKVSNDYMQTLWAKVLAGEVATPGSYSLRTLELLNNLSKGEAELISQLAPYVINDNVLLCVVGKKRDAVQSLLTKSGLGFNELMFLQELGILSAVDSIGITVSFSTLAEDSFDRAFTTSDLGILVHHEDKNRKVNCEGYLITQMGRELLKFVDYQGNAEYLKTIGQQIASVGFSVKLGKWERTSPIAGRLIDSEEIKP
ncbi:DUF2806 domain-containing protein [Vibrio breoganii]